MFSYMTLLVGLNASTWLVSQTEDGDAGLLCDKLEDIRCGQIQQGDTISLAGVGSECDPFLSGFLIPLRSVQCTSRFTIILDKVPHDP